MDIMRNRDAEMALLGCAINDGATARMIAGMPEELFSAEDTQAIHRAICRIIARGDAADLVSVSAEVACDLPEPEQLLIDMAQRGYMPSMARQYEAILQECRKRRGLADMASRLLRDITIPGSDVGAIEADAAKALRDSADKGGAATMQEALMAFLDSLSASKTGRVYTGIAALDALTGGLRGGKMVVLGARPGVGKTAMAIQMAVHAARHTGPVLIVSLEMDEAEIMSRIVAAESGVDVQALETGELTDEQTDKASATYAEISRLPIRIATRATTPLQVRREAMAMQENGGLAMVLIDYIQLMRADGRHATRYEEVSAISREIKLLAMDLGVPVIALTQFNRQSEGGGWKGKKTMPTMAEAKDSGSIEQDANLFLIQYEPEEPDKQSDAWQAYHMCQANGWAWQVLAIAKNRQGRTGSISLAFDKPHMRFKSIDLRR